MTPAADGGGPETVMLDGGRVVTVYGPDAVTLRQERAVLGAILRGMPGALETAAAGLDPRDFLDVRHQRIFAAALTAWFARTGAVA